MQSLADSTNGCKCFLIRLKGVFVSFSSTKYVATGFVKMKEYITKRKTVNLRTTPTMKTQHNGTGLKKL